MQYDRLGWGGTQNLTGQDRTEGNNTELGYWTKVIEVLKKHPALEVGENMKRNSIICNKGQRGQLIIVRWKKLANCHECTPPLKHQNNALQNSTFQPCKAVKFLLHIKNLSYPVGCCVLKSYLNLTATAPSLSFNVSAVVSFDRPVMNTLAARGKIVIFYHKH